MQKFIGRTKVFIKQTAGVGAVVRANFLIAQKIPKQINHLQMVNLSEYLIEASKIVCSKEQNKFKRIILSRRTVKND